jgi:Domain of unknown function (DUF5916)/Carbohydrate family 9 binding domain-like
MQPGPRPTPDAAPLHTAALALALALAATAARAEGTPAPAQPSAAAAAPAQPAPEPAPDAASPHHRSLRAARRQGPIVLDGVPDEPAWQAAEEAAGFTQYTPDEGEPSPVATRVRVLWDEEFLYVGAFCDDPEPSVDRLSRRDRWVDGDWLAVLLDTTLDRRTAYRFQVFSGGHQLDGLHYDDTSLTTDWDAAWESAVAHSERGWSVELKIPLRVLRIPEGVQQFGFNLVRHLVRRNEDDQWRFRPRKVAGLVSQLGLLTGLSGMKPVHQLELRPYLAGRVTRTDPWPGPVPAPFQGGPCTAQGLSPQGLAAGCVGLDLKYALASDLNVVATLNPDFGQVEADQLVLNLTTFESFFPEKRPFFLEGLDLFNTPVQGGGGGPYGNASYQLFYSRRIGRPPPEPDFTGTPTPDAVTLYLPASRPVAGAVKMTGMVGPASVGLLSAIEQPVDGAFYDPAAGRPFQQRVADARATAALRLSAPVGDRFIGGLFATAVDPLFAPAGRHAHVATADFKLFTGDRVFTLSGMASGSLVNGGGREVLRDGTVFDPGTGASGDGGGIARGGQGGGAGALTLDYTGEYTGGFCSADWLSPTFTSNDLGYMRRANLARGFCLFNVRQPHPTSLTQRIQLTLFGREVHDFGFNYRLYRSLGFEFNVNWNNNWQTQLGGYAEATALDDRELSDGTPLERIPGRTLYGYLSTDQRLASHLEVFASHTFTSHQGQGSTQLSATVGLRPHPRFDGGIDLDYSFDQGAIRSLQAATSPSGAPLSDDLSVAVQQPRLYLLAPLKARSFSLTFRGTFAFSPRLTLQAYAQLFTAGEAYGDALRYLAAPGKAPILLSQLAPAQADDPVPDNDYRSAGLNVNLILRWEWRLGSTLYLFYAHRTSNGFTPAARGLDFGGELAALSRGNGATLGDTLLMKIDLLAAL